MNTVHDANSVFLPLLKGQESSALAHSRHDTYQEFWARQQHNLDHIVRQVDAIALADIVHFVQNTSSSKDDNRIPTGLVITGPDASIKGRLLGHLGEIQLSKPDEELILIDSSQAPNLVTALRNVIRYVIVQRTDLDGYHSFLSSNKRSIPMNYDLELLQVFTETHGIKKIVIWILDVEAFNLGILVDLVSVLSSWLDRLPLVLLFGIATTIELFEARLPKSTIRLLNGQVFDVSAQGDKLYDIYKAVQSGSSARLWLGPAVSSVLLERSRDQDEKMESFAQAIRYAYMSHFFANPLSALLNESAPADLKSGEYLCDAIRNTNSFRRYAEEMLESKNSKAVKRLLDDDASLLGEARKAIQEGQKKMLDHHEAVAAFRILSTVLLSSSDAASNPFEVDVQALSGSKFFEAGLYTKTMSALRSLNSNQLQHFLEDWPLPKTQPEDLVAELLGSLSSLHDLNNGCLIRSAHDPKHATSTTVTKNNMVSLSKHAPKLSRLEEEFTALIDKIHKFLTDHFESKIIDHTNLFMHEAFHYDLRMPLASVFAPRARHAIERALDRPGDYLGCECCATANQAASGGEKPPPTSLLWQLWCEAGSIVNVRDLWEAFRAAIIDRTDEGEDERDPEELMDRKAAEKGSIEGVNERMALALFYRGLAELRMLGFVKLTKRKVDCLAKVAWRDL